MLRVIHLGFGGRWMAAIALSTLQLAYPLYAYLAISQSSMRSPVTRTNSFVLCVTTVN